MLGFPEKRVSLKIDFKTEERIGRTEITFAGWSGGIMISHPAVMQDQDPVQDAQNTTPTITYTYAYY